MECEYCENKFKSISSLNYHKENAKYCLQLQNKTKEDVKCTYCYKSFSTKRWLEAHYKRCKNNINNIFENNQILSQEK